MSRCFFLCHFDFTSEKWLKLEWIKIYNGVNESAFGNRFQKERSKSFPSLILKEDT